MKKNHDLTSHGGLIPIEVKDVSEDGRFVGYGAVFNNRDSGGDIILPGAFKDSLITRGATGVKMLWHHDPAEPIGKWTSIVEDSRGLKCEGRFLLSTKSGAEKYELAKEGVIDGLSIGYRAVNHKWDATRNARLLIKVDLWEVSVVTFPMNELSRIEQVKGGGIFATGREIEDHLRRTIPTLSKTQRVAVVAEMKSLLRDAGVQLLRDGGAEPEPDQRDAGAGALVSAFEQIAAQLRG